MKKIEIYFSNQSVFSGIYACLNCGKKIYLESDNKLPRCPKCGLNKFTIERKF